MNLTILINYPQIKGQLSSQQMRARKNAICVSSDVEKEKKNLKDLNLNLVKLDLPGECPSCWAQLEPEPGGCFYPQWG